MRALLIGGTSNVGKSTVARVLADRLGYEYVSTDKLGRHPGRPWPTDGRDVPPHVVEHYRSLTRPELVDAQLAHYERMWPQIEELIRTADGLVLEGSGVWPADVAGFLSPGVAAVWLSADERVVTARVHATSRYDDLPDERRYLIDQFLARSVDYQRRMLALVNELGLPHLDATTPRPPEHLATEILTASITT